MSFFVYETTKERKEILSPIEAPLFFFPPKTSHLFAICWEFPNLIRQLFENGELNLLKDLHWRYLFNEGIHINVIMLYRAHFLSVSTLSHLLQLSLGLQQFIRMNIL